ncbi:MAG TPA: ankyrin repeat domain-containing protein [Tepidisphaeraceae bacterium]|jgi:ankyrin repeat protein
MFEELIRAAAQGKTGAVIQMIKAGADVDFEGRMGWTPLRSAIGADRYHCVRVLVRAGADIHRVVLGHTALAFAVDTSIDATIQTNGLPGDEPTDVIRFLLKSGADPEPGLRVARLYKSERILGLIAAWARGERSESL